MCIFVWVWPRGSFASGLYAPITHTLTHIQGMYLDCLCVHRDWPTCWENGLSKLVWQFATFRAPVRLSRRTRCCLFIIARPRIRHINAWQCAGSLYMCKAVCYGPRCILNIEAARAVTLANQFKNTLWSHLFKFVNAYSFLFMQYDQHDQCKWMKCTCTG